MKAIKLTAVLLYYDGVQVFEGRDAIGGHYVGVGIGPGISTNRYMVTGAAPERLRQFRGGRLDLRTLLLEAPEGEWFITVDKKGGDSPLYLEPQPNPVAECDCLPGPNFILEDGPEGLVDDLALQHARERGNVIFEFSVEPPESVAHRIRMTTLGNILIRVQTVVKRAYESAARDLPERTRSNLATTDGHLMDVVVPAAPGSFRVLLEAVKPPNMFGSGELARGLQRLDEVFASAAEPDTVRETLKPYQGPLAGSFIQLLQFLVANQTGLYYSWADPLAMASQHSGVSEATARELAETLADFNSRRDASITLTGQLYRVNHQSGRWGLLTEKGKKFGKVAANGPNMDGLQVGNRYSFLCSEVELAGRESPELYVEHIL